nr:alpha/beta fold hydrolase [Puniceibacterium sp. IMCC21224]
MAHFLLVHGSCHGAWCWRDVHPALTALGHSSRAIDLPSGGADTTPLEEVTLDLCAGSVLDAIDGPVIVVGHSAGGFPISRAADLRSDGITRLVYLCAYVPRAGASLIGMRRSAPRQPLHGALVKSGDGLSYSVDPTHARAAFYHDCPEEVVQFAQRNLRPQPILPQATAITLGPGFATIPRSYILCEDDRAIPPEFQEVMAADFASQDVYHLPTSHSPFFSDPTKLAGLLDQITKQT